MLAKLPSMQKPALPTSIPLQPSHLSGLSLTYEQGEETFTSLEATGIRSSACPKQLMIFPPKNTCLSCVSVLISDAPSQKSNQETSQILLLCRHIQSFISRQNLFDSDLNVVQRPWLPFTTTPTLVSLPEPFTWTPKGTSNPNSTTGPSSHMQAL